MSKKESVKFNEDLEINQVESNQFLFPEVLEGHSFNYKFVTKDYRPEPRGIEDSTNQAHQADIKAKTKFVEDIEKCQTSEKNRLQDDIYEEEDESYQQEGNQKSISKNSPKQRKLFSPQRPQSLKLMNDESREYDPKKYLNQSIQNRSLIPNHFRYFELRLKSIEKRLTTIQSIVRNTANKPFEGATGYIQKKKKIRRKAIQINRKYKCCIQQCCKSYGSRSSLKGHLSIVHHIPKYRVTFRGTTIEIKPARTEEQK